MESAAIGELAHRQRPYKLDAIVMRHVIVPWYEPGRTEILAELDA